MRPAGTKHVEEEVAETTPILLSLEMPWHPIRWATAINARRDGPPAGRYRDRKPPFAIKDLHERRRPMRPREGVPVGHAELRLMGAGRDKRAHTSGRQVSKGRRNANRCYEPSSLHSGFVDTPPLPRET